VKTKQKRNKKRDNKTKRIEPNTILDVTELYNSTFVTMELQKIDNVHLPITKLELLLYEGKTIQFYSSNTSIFVYKMTCRSQPDKHYNMAMQYHN
jgi:hypothetical protein